MLDGLDPHAIVVDERRGQRGITDRESISAYVDGWIEIASTEDDTLIRSAGRKVM